MNDEELKSRYIGVELYKRLFALHLSDRSGAGFFPPDLRTFTEMGMPWIDASIFRKFKRGRIFTILAANLENRAFMDEVDDFLNNEDVLQYSHWQGVHYQSGIFENAYREFENTAKLLDYGPEWINYDHPVICIDQGFLVATRMLFDVYILDYHKSAGRSLRHFLYNFFEIQFERGAPLSRLRSLVKAACPDRLDHPKVDQIFSLSREESKALLSFARIRDSIDFNENISRNIEKRYGSLEEYKHDLKRWCRSFCFHFIVGHELGHVAYAQQERHSNFGKVIEEIKFLTGLQKDEYINECYCDYIAVRNCVFQADSRKIPIFLVILCAFLAWTLALSNTRGDQRSTAMLRSARQTVMRRAWIVYGKISEDDFDRFYAKLNSCALTAVKTLRDKLALVGQLNKIVNPQDLCFVKSLNTKLEIDVRLDKQSGIANLYIKTE